MRERYGHRNDPGAGVEMSVQFERHRALLDMALEACQRRHAWTAFPESPSSKIHGADVPADGLKKFQSLLGQPFDISVKGAVSISPMQNPLVMKRFEHLEDLFYKRP